MYIERFGWVGVRCGPKVFGLAPLPAGSVVFIHPVAVAGEILSAGGWALPTLHSHLAPKGGAAKPPYRVCIPVPRLEREITAKNSQVVATGGVRGKCSPACVYGISIIV